MKKYGKENADRLIKKEIKRALNNKIFSILKRTAKHGATFEEAPMSIYILIG